MLVTHICKYVGHHPDMTVGKFYDCRRASGLGKDRIFFYTKDDLNGEITLPNSQFVVISEIGNMPDCGKTVKINNQFPIFDDDPSLDAPDYEHKNATRKTNETHEDTESTKELRKYRYQPENGDYDK